MDQAPKFLQEVGEDPEAAVVPVEHVGKVFKSTKTIKKHSDVPKYVMKLKQYFVIDNPKAFNPVQQSNGRSINSLTPICVRAGTKNYRSVEFLRRNSTFFPVFRNTTQPPTTPHHGEPFALLRNELGGYAQSNTRATRPRVSARGLSLGFV